MMIAYAVRYLTRPVAFLLELRDDVSRMRGEAKARYPWMMMDA